MGAERVYTIGEFEFNTVSGTLRRSDAATGSRIGNYEARLLNFLIDNFGNEKEIPEEQYKERIITEVWRGRAVGDDSLYKRVQILRKAFDPDGEEYVLTNPYRLGKPPKLITPISSDSSSPERPLVERHPPPVDHRFDQDLTGRLMSRSPDLPGDADKSRLTANDPEDESSARQLWLKQTSQEHNRALHDREWAWTRRFLAPKGIDDFVLTYREDSVRYDDLMPLEAQVALEWWRTTMRKEDPNRVTELDTEPLGLQVRLVGMRFAHPAKYEITLAPAKFLHYAAIQQNLWRPELHQLRHLAFENALYGIGKQARLMLPSTFAIHMATVSSDGKALLRQRSPETPLYPLAWEAGPGELMHGPEYAKHKVAHHDNSGKKFPHFNNRGDPDLSLYLRNTVAEELGYDGARNEDFLIYGLAAEFRTLAPKLMVVYESNAPIKVLVDGVKFSAEQANAVSSIDLTVDRIVCSFTSEEFPIWGPTSKLALLLALIHKDGDEVVKEVQSRMDELQPISRF